MLKPIAIVLMAASVAPATAQPTLQSQPVTAAPSEAKSTSPGDRVICERQDQIGSRLAAKKVCKTALQWQEERREQRNDVEKIQQTINQTPSG